MTLMNTRLKILTVAVAGSLLLWSGMVQPAVSAVKATTVRVYSTVKRGYVMLEKVVKTDAEWKKILTPEQFEITRRQGTERSCAGAFWNNHRDGTYRCICCDNELLRLAAQVRFQDRLAELLCAGKRRQHHDPHR